MVGPVILMALPVLQNMSLPPMAPFPKAAWRAHVVPDEWEACLDAWILLAETHLSLGKVDFIRISANDRSVAAFLVSYVSEAALSSDMTSFGDVIKWKKIHKMSFFLSRYLFGVENPPEILLTWGFLADFCKIYGKKHSSKLIANLWAKSSNNLEKMLAILKSNLTGELDRGISGQPAELERQLKRLNHLFRSSPDAATFFMSGSDFLNGLISSFQIMNTPLRKTIMSTTYLLLIALIDGPKPNISLLADQLYSLKAAAGAHKAEPTRLYDSFVSELVTETPILKQIQHRIEKSGFASERAKSGITSLESFQKTRGGRWNRPVKRRVDKGKEVPRNDDEYGGEASGEVHVHQMSLITQVQDLFPDLGSRFVKKLLIEYGDDVEQVVSHLLEGPLPNHLESSDRSEALSRGHLILDRTLPDAVPLPTTLILPMRRNVFDDDEFDQLRVDMSRLHFGRRNTENTADNILKDRSNAPNKAAIFSALAAFDSDDDERDDTYDVEDVGGTVDSATPGNNPEESNADTNDPNDEALFRAFKMTPSLFGRDTITRRSRQRIALKGETGMTDEAIEGWALMLTRDSRRLRRLESKFSRFSGAQTELAVTAWRAEAKDSGTEGSDQGGRDGGAGQRSRGGRGRGRGGMAQAGNVVDRTGEKETEFARHKKEANKGSRANHNRRDQRAKKMVRAGFAV